MELGSLIATPAAVVVIFLYFSLSACRSICDTSMTKSGNDSERTKGDDKAEPRNHNMPDGIIGRRLGS